MSKLSWFVAAILGLFAAGTSARVDSDTGGEAANAAPAGASALGAVPYRLHMRSAEASSHLALPGQRGRNLHLIAAHQQDAANPVRVA